MVSDVVRISVIQFLDWSLLVTVILAIYFLIQFIFYTDKDEEKEYQKNVQKSHQELAKKLKDDKEKKKAELERKKQELEKEKEKKQKQKEHDNREKLLGPARGWLTKAIGVAEELYQNALSEKSAKSIKETKHEIKKLEDSLKGAKNSIHATHFHDKSDKKSELKELHEVSEAILKNFEENISGDLPKIGDDDNVWHHKADLIKNNANEVKFQCAALLQAINHFIETSKLELQTYLKNLEQKFEEKQKQQELERAAREKTQEQAKSEEKSEDKAKDSIEKQIENARKKRVIGAKPIAIFQRKKN